MAIGLKELLAERERLQGVVEEAKSAKTMIPIYNRLIAIYGADTVVPIDGEYPCPRKGCGKTFSTAPGLAHHTTAMHKRRAA